MAYPLAKAPTLRQFLKVAIEHGAIVAESKAIVTGPDGETRLRYVQKSKGSAPIILTVEDGELLTPILLSNLCRQLGLDPKLFSLNLGAVKTPRKK